MVNIPNQELSFLVERGSQEGKSCVHVPKDFKSSAESEKHGEAKCLFGLSMTQLLSYADNELDE